MQVLYDIAVLGAGQKNSLARTGVARVVENVARGLTKRPECELAFFQSLPLSILPDCLDYVNNNADFKRIPLVHSPSILGCYQKLDSLCKFVDYQLQVDGRSQQFLSSFKESLTTAQQLVNQYPYSGFEDYGDEPDLIHTTYYPIPEFSQQFDRAQRFLTVCDLIPILYPHWFGLKRAEDHVVYHALASINPQQDWVICISHATKNDLCEAIGIAPQRVFVTHLAADPNIFYPCQDREIIDRVKQRYQIPDRPYFLSLSTLEPRKNLEHTIRCFARVIQGEKIKDLVLVLVGSLGWDYQSILQEVETQGLSPKQIVFTGRVRDEDLAPLYSGAFAFVYPSLYEGFGLPPLEAMQCGTPVIVADTSSLPEVVEDAGISIPPQDEDALCQSMIEVYQNSSLRDKMVVKSLAQAQKFSWEKCAQATILAYQTALGESPHNREH